MTGELPIEEAMFEPLARGQDFEKFCREAVRLGHCSIALPSSRVEEAYTLVGDSNLKLSCLVGFPFGTADADVKRFETEVAVDYGVHEISLMVSLAYLKEGDYSRVLREIRDVVEAADERPVKVFVEPHLLSPRELEEAVRIVLDSGAQFISTTLWSTVSLLDEVRRLRELVGDRFGIIATTANDQVDSNELRAAGATRLMIARVGKSVRSVEQAFGI
jgi:deoxyribose-phosphate aldolase